MLFSCCLSIYRASLLVDTVFAPSLNGVTMQLLKHNKHVPLVMPFAFSTIGYCFLFGSVMDFSPTHCGSVRGVGTHITSGLALPHF